MSLVNPQGRKVCAGGTTIFVNADLIDKGGFPLMVHQTLCEPGSEPRTGEEWTCSHEPSGYSVAKGPSPALAVGFAVLKIQTHLASYHETVAKLPKINGA